MNQDVVGNSTAVTKVKFGDLAVRTVVERDRLAPAQTEEGRNTAAIHGVVGCQTTVDKGGRSMWEQWSKNGKESRA